MRIAAPLLVAMCLLAACDRLEPSSAPRTVPAPAPAGTDRGGSDKYSYEIRYATLPAQDAPLAVAMRAFGEQQKREFLAHFGDDSALPEGVHWPWEMHLDFDVRAQSTDFLSVLGSGETYSGGAHGNPLLASFVLHRPSLRVLALPELFVNADAGLQVLAAEARRALHQRQRAAGAGAGAGDDRRIDDGTAPKAENYTIFMVDGDVGGKAKGLILIFPAYQVASYAQGPQQVNVPAARFRDLLKPEFKRAFVATAAK
jgi:hypothetical protein